MSVKLMKFGEYAANWFIPILGRNVCDLYIYPPTPYVPPASPTCQGFKSYPQDINTLQAVQNLYSWRTTLEDGRIF